MNDDEQSQNLGGDVLQQSDRMTSVGGTSDRGIQPFVADESPLSGRRRNSSLLRIPDPVVSQYTEDDVQDYLFHTSGGLEGSPQLTLNYNSHSHLHSTDAPVEDHIPTRQVFVLEEDLTVEITGYDFVAGRMYVYWALCFASGGLLHLICRWFPRLYLLLTARVVALREAKYLLATNSWGQLDVLQVSRQFFGHGLSGLFQHITPPSLFPVNNAEMLAELDTCMDVHSFSYHCITFIMNPLTNSFVENTAWRESTQRSFHALSSGLASEEVMQLKSVFGFNSIDIPAKSLGRLLMDEVLHPFYIFQVFSIILWCFEKYYYYAFCILVISSVSTAVALVDQRKNRARLREISHFECQVRVRRNNEWSYISSTELVPGDVYCLVPELTVFPCDSVLMSGDCIVNESILTGESVPVFKVSAHESEFPLANIHPDVDSRYFLFGGTKIVRFRAPLDENSNPGNVMALVVRTGFSTTKGGLVRSMLFPKPSVFKFYRDSFKFIGVLSLIAFFGFCLTLYWLIKNKMSPFLIVVRALDLITIVVPPALPAAMSIGTTFAINRLKKAWIFCISPPRVNIAGKVDVFVFDKTGTLTEDGLDVYGVHPVNSASVEFDEVCHHASDMTGSLQDFEKDIVRPPVLHALAACHSLKCVDGALIGDPMDLKMFAFTEWELEETAELNQVAPTIVRPRGSRRLDMDMILQMSGKANESEQVAGSKELGIIRCFEFASSLRRMSVITKRLDGNVVCAFMKGAPEIVRDICVPQSIPDDFDDILESHSHQGYRVLAFAGKQMHGMSWLRAQKIEREAVESEMHFLGFIIFENKLKNDTKPALDVLARARIRDIMCTGDNLLTAVCVARQCGLIDPQNLVFSPRFVDADSTHHTVVWQCIDDPRLYLDPRTLLPIDELLMSSSRSSSSGIHGEPGAIQLRKTTLKYANDFDPERSPASSINSYDLAITGEVFDYILANASKDTIERILLKAEVFARMAPDQKLNLVERLQGIGYCVGMCGDGANDCSALTAADVGISLSEAEASVAAPFTSRLNNIGCVLKLIREGRAALVTSFSCFKYIALYSMIQFSSVTLMYTECRNLGDFQYLYIDLFLILPIAVVMGRTESCRIIYPKRPTANLVSRTVLTSIIGHIIVSCIFQVVFFLWAKKNSEAKFDCHTTTLPTPENSMLFLFSCFQYIWTALIFSVGYPYRANISSNGVFLAILVILTLLNTLLVLMPGPFFSSVLELWPISHSEKFVIMIAAAVNFGVMYACETFAFPILSRAMGKLIYRKPVPGEEDVPLSLRERISRGDLRVVKPGRKEYKVISERMKLRR